MTAVAFIIPLKPKRLCLDWQEIKNKLANTLRSIQGSANTNYFVYLITDRNDIDIHDLPLDWWFLKKLRHLEVEPIRQENSLLSGQHDKNLKRIWAGYQISLQPDQPRFYMLLDADDAISNRLVDQIINTGGNGCFFKNGYVYDVDTGMLRFTKVFWAKCGSRCAFAISKETQMPRSPNDLESYFSECCISKNKVNNNRKLKTIKEPLVMYVIGGQERISADPNLPAIKREIAARRTIFENTKIALIRSQRKVMGLTEKKLTHSKKLKVFSEFNVYCER